MDQLAAINRSFEIIPPGFVMLGVVAAAHGWKPKEAEAARSEGTHPGGAFALMFPDGQIRLGG